MLYVSNDALTSLLVNGRIYITLRALPESVDVLLPFLQ
jgi:hypothetical protein